VRRYRVGDAVDLWPLEYEAAVLPPGDSELSAIPDVDLQRKPPRFGDVGGPFTINIDRNHWSSEGLQRIGRIAGRETWQAWRSRHAPVKGDDEATMLAKLQLTGEWGTYWKGFGDRLRAQFG
jgi:hypothetical protein